MTDSPAAPRAPRAARPLRAAGWALLALAVLPAGVSQWQAHERLMVPDRHEPVPPDWVRYDAVREHLRDIDRVHIYSDVPNRIILLRRYDLQFSALPALIWTDPPGRAAAAPPDARTAFLVDAASAPRANLLTAEVRAAAAREGWRTEVIPLERSLRLLRFHPRDGDGPR